MVVHARTLELYRQLGFGDTLLREGIPVKGAQMRQGGDTDGPGHELASFSFEGIGEQLSPYPTPLAYPQDDHERFLIKELERDDIRVEWQTTLMGFTQRGSAVSATMAHRDGSTESVDAAYLAGCDGGHSVVRETLDVRFPGGTYPQLYYVVDCETDGGFETDLIFNIGRETFALLLPVRSRGVQRLIGLVPPDLPQRDDLTFDELRSRVEPLIGRRVTSVNWFSTYRVHHRVAEHFRVGRAFILGDAGHVHSPAGAQGMNTGIGDAMNLGWKLAMVLEGRADDGLLDTYESERIRFARKLVETTDRAFTQAVAGGVKSELVRRFLLPLVFSVGTSTAYGRRAAFRLISQIGIEYEDSALSEGKAGHVVAGDRLPWVADVDNFAPLTSLDWQVHVYGTATAGLQQVCKSLRLPIHCFTWTDSASDAGLRRDAVYLVRPDGYVGYDASAQAGDELSRYWNDHRLRMRDGSLAM